MPDDQSDSSSPAVSPTVADAVAVWKKASPAKSQPIPNTQSKDVTPQISNKKTSAPVLESPEELHNLSQNPAKSQPIPNTQSKGVTPKSSNKKNSLAWFVLLSLLCGCAAGLGVGFGTTSVSFWGAGSALLTATQVGGVALTYGTLSASLIGLAVFVGVLVVCAVSQWAYQRYHSNGFMSQEGATEVNPSEFTDSGFFSDLWNGALNWLSRSNNSSAYDDVVTQEGGQPDI